MAGGWLAGPSGITNRPTLLSLTDSLTHFLSRLASGGAADEHEHCTRDSTQEHKTQTQRKTGGNIRTRHTQERRKREEKVLFGKVCLCVCVWCGSSAFGTGRQAGGCTA